MTAERVVQWPKSLFPLTQENKAAWRQSGSFKDLSPLLQLALSYPLWGSHPSAGQPCPAEGCKKPHGLWEDQAGCPQSTEAMATGSLALLSPFVMPELLVPCGFSLLVAGLN